MTYTVNELKQAVGKRGYIYFNGLGVYVEIFDVKQSYGTIRFLVAPINGKGSAWVLSTSVSINELNQGVSNGSIASGFSAVG
jgi:hypothetical protein